MRKTTTFFVMLAFVLPAAPAAAAGNEATISNFSFSPEPVRIAAGATLKWTNLDSSAHTVTADDGSWTSTSLNKDNTFSHTFSQPGTVRYHCAIHDSMTGTVEVEAATTTTTTAAPTTTTTTARATTTSTAPVATPTTTPNPKPAATSTTRATAAPTTTTTAQAAATTAPPPVAAPEDTTATTQAALNAAAGHDADSNATPLVIGAALLLLGGAAGWWAARRHRGSATG
jgi:plastocyanin